MQLNAAASTVLVIFYVILSLILVAVLGILAVALFRLQAKLEELTARVEPLLQKTEGVLTVAGEKVATVGTSAEQILARGEETAADVQSRVEHTGAAVQRTVHAPVIGLNSLLAGVSEGVSTFSKLQRGAEPERGGPLGGVEAVEVGEEPPVRYGSGLAYRRGAAARQQSRRPDATRQAEEDVTRITPLLPAETPVTGAETPSFGASTTSQETTGPGPEERVLTVTGGGR